MENMVRPREAAFKETTDLAFAAYCHMRGLKIMKVQEWRKHRALEYKFVFSDPSTEENPNGLWGEFEFDFANSEARRFDSSVRTLKQLGKRKSR